MTDMTAEQALEWLRTIAAISGAVVSDRPLSFSYQEAVRFQEAVKALSAPRVPEGFALIPLDPRNGQPQITNDMVGLHSGAHTFLTTATDEDGEEISVRVDVPWDACKAIYKGMAKTAMLAAATAPADSDPMPMPLFTTMEGEEIKRLRERVNELEGVLLSAYGAMNFMGDILNSIDAVTTEDVEKTADAFEKVSSIAASLRGGSDE